jgi:hypothetical protein
MSWPTNALRFALAAALVLLASAHAEADGRHFALVVGANVGATHEGALRYSENEARRLAEVLRGLGEFDADDTVVLAHPSRAEVIQAFERLRSRAQGVSSDSLLFVFYSGHADAEALHLGAERLALAELRDAVSTVPASARVLVVDACRSGAITRVKGGRSGPSFEVHLEQPIGAQGLAILTSSAAGEDAQESDEIGSSVFTHFLTSALLGAGDKNGDGIVTLEEAFAYASERTVLATSATQVGPQHPTFRYELGGRGGLALTHPGQARARIGLVQFPDAGWYLLRRKDGPVVAELQATRNGQRLALEAGHYRVSERLSDYYLEGDIDVAAGSTLTLSPGQLRRFSYPRGARKGVDVTLFPHRDPPPPLYRRWWLWTAVSAVAAGVGVGVGVGLTHQPREQVVTPVSFGLTARY